MPTDDQYEATLLWAIDRQKADFLEIRNQLRRYLIVAITLVFIRGLAFISGNEAIPNFLDSATLAQDGILWQTNILPTKTAPAFTDSITMLGTIFSFLAVALIANSVYSVYAIERMPNLYPTGSTKAIIGRDIGKLEDWVSENNTTLDFVEKQRQRILLFGKEGITILGATYILNLLGRDLLIGAILFLMYLYYKFYDILYVRELFGNHAIKKLATSAAIVITMVQPVSIYQDSYGQLPNKILLYWLIIIIIIHLVYLRKDILLLIRKLRSSDEAS